MTYASSVSSNEANTQPKETVSQKLKKMRDPGRPQIRIAIDGADDSWVMTYSTLDKIEGKVFITCPHKTTVDSLQIDFAGTAKTFVEKLSTSTAVSGKSEAFHQFLKLSQPIQHSAWPAGGVLEANKTYEFRFLFIIPEQLLPRICRHNVSSSTVQQEHLTLPPSFGDQSSSGRGNTLLDDFAPNMARIKYAITVALQEADTNGPLGEPVTKVKKVRILPAIDEKPPLSVEGPDSDYRLRSEKDIRKGVFKGKLGSLIIEAAQPRAMRVPSYKSEQTSPDSTVVTVNLRFDPADDKARPPKLGNLQTKLKVASFYSSAARTRLPTKKDMIWDFTQGVHAETVSLNSRCMSNVDWDFHDHRDASRPGSPERRSSTLSESSLTGEVPEPSAKYQGKGFYTAQILVPISLPDNKVWIPTFHTCLISRTYGVNMHLGVTSGNMGGIDLKIPVQISSEGNPAAVAQHRDSMEEQAYEAMDADDFFAPRTISPIDGQYVGRSSLSGLMNSGPTDLPPEYDAFPRAGSRIPVAV
ncbi:hypothetical protein C1H76_7192 [Elsinoe australis]|uniref:Arrestin-like N-terminal domain-containing protein n=1 Tax=Elsinoe australis TaxID=40998 RepID=A0A4U7AXX2_9PEZI|nr:hypothetical protein C1H76_7192 [Elsinoe australis]